jgi:hypothetical protein
MLGTRRSCPHPVQRRVNPDIEASQLFHASRSVQTGRSHSQQSIVSFYRGSQPVDQSLGKPTSSGEFESCELSHSMTLM